MVSFSVKIPESIHDDLIDLSAEFWYNKTSVVRLALKRLRFARQGLLTKRPPQVTEGVA
jgi:hypothetical protein